MDIRTFAELTTPDERTLRFTPLGLATGGKLSPEHAAKFQQESIAAADLLPAVPEGTRSSFERLRTLHAYGVLCYDLFTVVDDLSWVVLEQALRERFIAFYEGVIPLVDKNGAESSFPASDFEAVNTAFRPGGSHYRKGWHLQLRSQGTRTQPPLTLRPLLRWAREEGLLFLSVTVVVFMHLNRRERYRSGSRSEREARVETQPAAEAVEQLIRAYGRLVFHLIHGMIHDWHESEDLTQEVFLSAFRGIDVARTARGAQFQAKAWLLYIALNRVRMYRRRQRLMHFVPFSQLETAEAGADMISELAAPAQPGGYCTVEGGGDPASLVAERDAVGRALAGLPDPLRVPLLLSVVGGLPGAEIAHILGVGETAVRRRLSRARRQFQARYAGQSGEVVRDAVAATEHRPARAAPDVGLPLAFSPRCTSLAAEP